MSIIGTLYSTVGIMVLVGYMPQIIRLWKTHTDCRDISLHSWMIWNYTASVSLLYSVFELPDLKFAMVNSVFELPDLKFAMVNSVNVLCINIIIALTLYKRHHYSKKSGV